MVRDSSKLVCCVKGLPDGGGHAFVTGETTAAGSECLCVYDMATLSSFSSAQPVRQYTEHEELITCLSLFPPNHLHLYLQRPTPKKVEKTQLFPSSSPNPNFNAKLSSPPPTVRPPPLPPSSPSKLTPTSTLRSSHHPPQIVIAATHRHPSQ